MRIYVSLFLFSLFYMGEALAGVQCSGTVSGLRLWGNGSSWVAVSLKEYPGTWILCDTDNNYGGVAPNACNAMYSMALTAFAANKKINLNFSGYTSCADIPSWDVTLPSKFNMLNTY